MAVAVSYYGRYNTRIAFDAEINGTPGSTVITGAITTVVTADLSASKVVVSNADGKIVSSTLDASLLLNLANSTSDLQDQIDAFGPPSSRGDLTEASSSVLTISGGTEAVFGSGTSIQVKLANGSQGGYLSSADWTTFNSKLAPSLTSAYVFVGNGSNVATGVPISGDVTISNAGVVAIAANSIVNADINPAAGILQSKMVALATSRVMVTNSSGFATTALPTDTEINHIVGATSNLQSQINGKLSVSLGGIAEGDILYYNGSAWVNLARGSTGEVLTATASSIEWNTGTSNGLEAGGTTGQFLIKTSGTDYDTEWHTLSWDDLGMSATEAEINGLMGLTATSTELNYNVGLNSAVQTQLDSKQSSSLAYGAILVGNASDIASQLSPGTDDYVLTMVGGSPQWQPNTPPGDVSGPVSSTDNAIVRWNTASGDSIQDSGIIIDDTNNISGIASLTVATGGALRTSTSNTNTLLLQAYNTGGASYTTFATLTAGASPTMDLSTSVTVGSAAIYRVGGTDVSLADGGTGASLADPGADRIMFWDESANQVTWLTLGSNLSITGTTINATGGGSSLLQKTETGTTYTVVDADDGYVIYFTNVLGCDVTMDDAVTTNISFTTVRADGAGPVDHLSDGTSVLFTIGGETEIQNENGGVTWVKANSTDYYGFGALGAGGGGSGTVTSVTGTSNRISISGTATDPIVDISSLYVGQTSITTLGTIATGTWNATAIGLTKGGTGLTALGTANQLLRVNAGATALEYFTPGYISGNETITLSGDVTGSGTTSIVTTIANDSVVTARILNANVTYAKLQDVTALSVVGRSSNTDGVSAAITAGSDYNILRRSGTSIGFGSIDLSQSGAVGSSILPVANGGTGSATGIFWNLSGTSTMGAATTMSSAFRLAHTFSGTWTSTTNADYHVQFSPTITADAIGRVINAVNIAPTMATGGFANTVLNAFRVNGRTVIKGLSTTGTSGTFIVTDSGDNQLVDFSDDGNERFGNAGSRPQRSATSDGSTLNKNGNGMLYTTGAQGSNFFASSTGAGVANGRIMRAGGTHVTTSGTTSLTGLLIDYTVNQAGGTGDSYGIRFAPTYTAVGGNSYFIVSSAVTANSGLGTLTPTALLHLTGSTTARASLRIASGTAPTTPNEGDIWNDGANLKIFIGGTTKTFTII